MSLLLQSTPYLIRMDVDLKSLFNDLPLIGFTGDWKTRVTGICTDSRRVTPGVIFFALKGLHTDGNHYVDEAIDRGAATVVTDGEGTAMSGANRIRVKNPKAILAEVARRFYSNPQDEMDLMGVTGTNGKTTVAYLVKHMLEESRGRVGMLGTVQYDLGKRTLPANRTTPESMDIYAMLAQMRESVCDQAILEVSSHGIDQGRVDGLYFKTAAFLNLTQDHIDYHGSLKSYFMTKSRLFTGQTGRVPEIAVVNSDDPFSVYLMKLIPRGVCVITCGTNERCDFRVTDLVLESDRTRFKLTWPFGAFEVESPLLGKYNVSNLLVAFAICFAQGNDVPLLAEKLADFPGVPGRMERVDEGQPFSVLVDYAHTDDALKNALSMLRGITSGRLLVVFGCGGNRDRSKRPLMTQAVLKAADFCWATADNPRKESLETIFRDMKKGAADSKKIRFIKDRRRAISLALDAAQVGDCLLIAGKGHETFQDFTDAVAPFDDRLVAQELIRIKLRKQA